MTACASLSNGERPSSQRDGAKRSQLLVPLSGGLAMGLTARTLISSAALALLAASPAFAQMDEVPRPSYYACVEEYYAGGYQQAERDFRRERGIRTGQTNWIDSVCYHAMTGEVLYQKGRNA